MARLIWTEPALSDLNEIADYIALEHIDTARRLVQQVLSSVERLEQFPESGRKPPELGRSRYREIIIGPCRIFYRSDGNNVYIIYVMRSERELRKYLIDDRTEENS